VSHSSDDASLRRAQGWATSAALLPLRAFIGGTFVFAGLQKLANPNFFNQASPISIWSQLVGAERTSPLRGLLGHLLRFSTPLGALIAVGEVAIGIGVLLGLLTRIAAAGGMALSLGLFLTVSFHASPYYTGADIVFFFAFTPLLLGGPGPMLALDAALQRRARQMASRPGAMPVAAAQPPGPYAQYPPGPFEGYQGGEGARAPRLQERLARRQLLARAAAAAGAVAGAAMGLDVLLGRLIGGARTTGGAPTLQAGHQGRQGTPAGTAAAGGATTTTSPPSPGTSTSGPAGTTTTRPPGASQPAGQAIGPASAVAVGGAARFQDPATGDPALVIQLTSGDFVAYDAICPHAGCTVGYSPANKLIVCPCHGSEFDPSNGDVVAGPAATGLRPIGITRATNGELYAV
jgi:thiosulfate dehydrogenase [quinone] large subunit